MPSRRNSNNVTHNPLLNKLGTLLRDIAMGWYDSKAILYHGADYVIIPRDLVIMMLRYYYPSVTDVNLVQFYNCLKSAGCSYVRVCMEGDIFVLGVKIPIMPEEA